MKQDTNMEHSAEWLRGAYRIASRYAPMDVVMQINVLLAAAEAREATQPSAAEVIRVAKAALEGLASCVDGDEPESKKADKALATISAWEAGNGKP